MLGGIIYTLRVSSTEAERHAFSQCKKLFDLLLLYIERNGSTVSLNQQSILHDLILNWRFKIVRSEDNTLNREIMDDLKKHGMSHFFNIPGLLNNISTKQPRTYTPFKNEASKVCNNFKLKSSEHISKQQSDSEFIHADASVEYTCGKFIPTGQRN